MKIYLDDVRPAPDGWILARWPSEVIDYIKTGKVTHVSLDHDLGDDSKGTGYDVLTYLEGQARAYDGPLPTIFIHTANPVARARMFQAVNSIDLFLQTLDRI